MKCRKTYLPLVGITALIRLQEEGILMINLTGKSVFVKTQEEYLSVLKIARFQGFKWARENHLNHIEIPFPNILNFYDNKTVTYSFEKTLLEASKIVEDEKKSRMQ